jgi:hypothetical protein
MNNTYIPPQRPIESTTSLLMACARLPDASNPLLNVPMRLAKLTRIGPEASAACQEESAELLRLANFRPDHPLSWLESVVDGHRCGILTTALPDHMSSRAVIELYPGMVVLLCSARWYVNAAGCMENSAMHYTIGSTFAKDERGADQLMAAVMPPILSAHAIVRDPRFILTSSPASLDFESACNASFGSRPPAVGPWRFQTLQPREDR